MLLVLVVLFVSGLGGLGRYVSVAPAVHAGRRSARAGGGRAGVLVAMHVYLATCIPPTRPAFRGITLGSVVVRGPRSTTRWVAAVDARED